MIPLLLAGLARADVATVPDWECPPGSVGVASHVPHCAPAPCDATCEVGCRPLGLCLLEHDAWWDTGATPATWVSAEAACDSQADCEGDAVCAIEDRCAAADDATADRGCGCSTASPPLAALLGSLALLAVRRRRSS